VELEEQELVVPGVRVRAEEEGGRMMRVTESGPISGLIIILGVSPRGNKKPKPSSTMPAIAAIAINNLLGYSRLRV
jgi:hypothetical protein